MIEVEKKVFLEKKQLDYIENNATFIIKKSLEIRIMMMRSIV